MFPNIRAQRPPDGVDPDLITMELWRAMSMAAGDKDSLPRWKVQLAKEVTDSDIDAVEALFPGAAAMVMAGRKSDAYKDDRKLNTSMADVEVHIKAGGDTSSEVAPVDMRIKASVQAVRLAVRGQLSRVTWELRMEGSSRELGALVDHQRREVEANLYSFQPQLFGDHAPAKSEGIVPQAGDIVIMRDEQGEDHIGEVKAVTHPGDESAPILATINPLSGTPIKATPDMITTRIVVDWGELNKAETLRSFKARCKRDSITPDWGLLIQAAQALLSEGAPLLGEGGQLKITVDVIERAVDLAKASTSDEKVAK